MRKCMFEKGKRTAAAAALAFVLAAGSIAGCGGSGGLEEAVQAVGEAVGGQGEDRVPCEWLFRPLSPLGPSAITCSVRGRVPRLYVQQGKTPFFANYLE